jgi:hypothetical protein
MFFFRYYAICRPSEYQRSRAFTNPWIDVGLAFACGTIIQIPWYSFLDNAICLFISLPLNIWSKTFKLLLYVKLKQSLCKI